MTERVSGATGRISTAFIIAEPAHGRMVPPLDTRRLLRESAPVAVILLFWTTLSTVAHPIVASGLHRAGLIMALLYTVVRGVALARRHTPTPAPETVVGILRENVRVVIAAGAWFVAAELVYVVERLWEDSDLPGAFTSPAEALAFVLAGAGVATILLYAIVVGLPRIRDSVTETGSGAAGATSADD